MSVETFAFGGKHTPEQVLVDVLNDGNEKKCLVVVYLDGDDYIQTAWSDGSMLGRMGMLDVAKLRMFDSAQEDT